MKYIRNLQLPYEEIGEDNLYDDSDLSATDIVEARYWKKNGYEGNPDICSLPRPSTNREIQAHHSIPLYGYDEEAIQHMSISERKRGILSLRSVRFPFPFHAKIDQFLHSALISSYSGRKLGITEQPDVYEIGGETKVAKIITGDTDLSGNSLGFSVIGVAGSGKSTAFQLVSEKYPKAILHRIPESYYIQIPIIRLTAFANGNLAALYYMFARQIDSILDGKDAHYGQIKKTSNLGKMTEMIITWIKRYHIGVIVIDEIQLMDFRSSSPKSMENLLTVSAMTGVSLVMIGTEDASTHWKNTLRLQRRTEGLLVKADEYCKQREYVELIIRRLWRYQWLRKKATLTKAVSQALYDESMGSIDLLILLWMTIQYEAISGKTEPAITVDYIHKIAKIKFQHMQSLLKDSLTESEQKYLSARQSVIDEIRGSVEADEQRRELERLRAESERNIRDHYDRDLLMSCVVEAISSCYDYSEMLIRKAFAKAEQEEGFKKLNRKQATKKVLEYLGKSKNRKTKSFSGKETEKVNAELADKLRETLEENMGKKEAV